MHTYTLTSDFGLQNYITSAVKGSILSYENNCHIVDISHSVKEFDVYQGAYIFKSAFSYFAAKTHHFLLVGLHNTTHSPLLFAQINAQYIYFVDNGLAHLIFKNSLKVFSINLEPSFEYNVGNIARTFAQASSFINKGTAIEKFAKPYQLLEVPNDVSIVDRDSEIIVQVLYIDNFKNVVINITEAQFNTYRKDRNFIIQFVKNEQLIKINKSYSDVSNGRKVAFFNNAGYLEIAMRGGNAAELFGFEINEDVNEIYRTIKIIFN
jgi:S-adenosyl-L-methionine hydrolase (adenosine-forming)